MSNERCFDAVMPPAGRGSSLLPLPFDPDQVWGKKPVHHIAATIGACKFRGPIARTNGGHALKLGPAWLRDCAIAAGAAVRVVLWPEGPQRSALAPDLAAALASAPKAAAFFDGLAQFYRKGYLAWIDATKRRPDERVRRIRTTIKLLTKGVKQRPH